MDDLPENCHSLNLSVWVWGLAVTFTLVGEFAHGVTQRFVCFDLGRPSVNFNLIRLYF